MELLKKYFSQYYIWKMLTNCNIQNSTKNRMTNFNISETDKHRINIHIEISREKRCTSPRFMHSWAV